MLRDQYHVSPPAPEAGGGLRPGQPGGAGQFGPQEISLYVGIPFCPTRCAYCSFISAAGSANRLIPQYLEALLTEIDAAGAAARQAGKTVRAVYIGAAPPPPWRPTSWPACWSGWAPPSPWPPARSAPWRPAGRIPSPGKSSWPSGPGRQPDLREPQTMSDPVLAAIGRDHRAADIRRAYALAREVGAWPSTWT